MGKRQNGIAALCAAWLCLAGFAPPRLPAARWDPDESAILTVGGVPLRGATERQPVQPGEQYPAPNEEGAFAAATPASATDAAGPLRGKADWRLSIDMSAIADSNFTNGPDLETVPIDLGDGPLPVPLDPNLREKGGIGFGASANAGLRLPVAAEIALAFDAEGYVVDYPGGDHDDLSALIAAGLEFGSGSSPAASVQILAFDRWYGGVNALKGVGLRGYYRHGLSDTTNLRLAIDARIFDSGYGDGFNGGQSSLYLSADTVLDPRLSFSAGVYGHRQWLRDEAFSYLEVGGYGGLSYYIGSDLSGGISGGIARTVFDRPFLLLGPEAREDWRVYGSTWLTTRQPVILGLYPSLTYTYNRTGSSIAYYRADRHRLRLGMSRKF